jgi:hypothetical protein
MRKWLLAEDNPNDEWGTKMDSDSADSKVAFSDNSSFVKEEGHVDESLINVDGDVLEDRANLVSENSSEEMKQRFAKLEKKQISDNTSLHDNTLGSYGKENGS